MITNHNYGKSMKRLLIEQVNEGIKVQSPPRIYRNIELGLQIEEKVSESKSKGCGRILYL